MNNLAEKLPEAVRTKLNDVEEQSRKLVEKLDAWVDSNVPSKVAEPLRSEDGVTLKAIRSAATAATEELVNRLKVKWGLLKGDQEETESKPKAKKANVETSPASKGRTRKAPAKRKPTPRAKTAAKAKTPTKAKTASKAKTTTKKAPASKPATTAKKAPVRKTATTAKKTPAKPAATRSRKAPARRTVAKKTTPTKKN